MKKWLIYPTPSVCSTYAFQTRYSTFKKKKEKKVNFVDEGTYWNYF